VLPRLSRLKVGSLPLWLTALLVGVLALLPRCLGLADFFTEDESFHWVWRVRHFSGAVRQELWVGTNLTGHPGVTTMWLGTLGRWLADALGVPEAGLAEGSANIAYLAMLRLPLALVNTLAVVVGYLVLRRLLRPAAALLAGVLWATSPFLVAHSRLLHLDALLTSFMTLSVLFLLLATSPPIPGAPRTPRRGWATLGAAGGLAGLAFLTKAPSLALLPLTGVLLLLFSPPDIGTLRRLAWTLARYGLWLGCAALVVVVLWPTMWVEPAQAFGAVIAEIRSNGAVPHHTGNYFLGQPVADPGWLFYPFVILWRSTPLLLVGLLLLPLAFRQDDPQRGGLTAGERRVVLALLLFVLLFGGLLSLAPKKFDRYLLPAWPALAVLAAFGLLWLWHRVGELSTRLSTMGHRVAAALAPTLVGLMLAGTLLWYHPYYLAYFNPLLGGSATARHVLLVGWGEGMEQVGAWLRTRPDVAHSPVLTWGPRTLEPFIEGRTMYLNEQHLADPASYAVLYVRGVQRQEAAAAQEAVRQVPPLYSLHRYGIPYAHVYQPPRPYDEPLDAVFGEGLHLRGFSQARSNNTLTITPSWNVQTDQPGGLFTFVHVLAPDGRRVAQVDAPIDEGLFAEWQAGQQFGSPLPVALPPDLPAGRYRVVMGVYEPASGRRLPLTQGAALPASIDGEGVLEISHFTQKSTTE
jgi:4-amino-4-deoxy-L-arabinose transferase-like glycosyltransferase